MQISEVCSDEETSLM